MKPKQLRKWFARNKEIPRLLIIYYWLVDDVYKQETNPVYEFKINIFDNWNLRKIPKYIVYGMYKEFCKENGYNFLSKIKFHKEFKDYLSEDWKTDAVDRFNWEDLIDEIGDLDNYKSEIKFPEAHKSYRAYENRSLKAI